MTEGQPMPQFLHLPPVAQAVLTITGFVLAVIRLLTASRPFWTHPWLPAWLQKGLPAAMVALGAIPMAIEHARSWLDIAVALVVAGSAWYTASRGDKRTPGSALILLLLCGLALPTMQGCTPRSRDAASAN